jgi:hypothetical protein
MMMLCQASAAPVISGTAYPGETLTSTVAGQWIVNGSNVSGETGSTYVIRLNDIGYVIKQAGSNELTCWSPADISAVAAFWTPYRNVYTTVSPDVAATNGQNITRWNDIVGGMQYNSGASVPTYSTAGSYPLLTFNSTDHMTCSDAAVFRNKSRGEIFWSGRITANGAGTSGFTPIVQFATSTSGYARLAIVTKSSNVNLLYARASPNISTQVNSPDRGTIVGAGDYVLNARAQWSTGGTVALSMDNDTATTTALGATANSPDTDSVNNRMGANTGIFTNMNANGEYRCICLVNASLTATERSQIARYMGLFIGKNIALV